MTEARECRFFVCSVICHLPSVIALRASVESRVSLKYSTCAVSQIPLSTIIIAVAMLAFSVVIVSKLGGKIPLSRRVQASLLVLGAASLLVGIYLHLNQTPAAKPRTAGVARRQTPAGELSAFTFSPLQARWGDQVEIRLPFSADSTTVYLNGVPLPKRVNGDRMIHVTIPSGAKTGYLELERGGTRVSAPEPISIKP